MILFVSFVLMMDVLAVRYWHGFAYEIIEREGYNMTLLKLTFKIVLFNSTNRHTESCPFRIASSATSSEYLLKFYQAAGFDKFNLIYISCEIHHKLPYLVSFTDTVWISEALSLVSKYD